MCNGDRQPPKEREGKGVTRVGKADERANKNRIPDKANKCARVQRICTGGA
jgi:hypothetical protein